MLSGRPSGLALIIALGLVVLSVIGLMQDWLGIPGKFLFIAMICVAAFVMMVELYQWIIMMIELPFFLFSYLFMLPIKMRERQILHNGSPVIAYWMRQDRVVLATHLFVPQHMNTIEGTSEFRGAGKLARMKELLDSANVPEHPLNEKRLQEVVAIWNQDHELCDRVRRTLRNRSGVELPPREPLIVLDTHSRERIDRVLRVIEFLWESEKYRDVREDIIQLAMWRSFAVDVCYGRETQGILGREFPS